MSGLVRHQRAKIDRLLHQREQVSRIILQEQDRLEQAEAELESVTKAQQFVQGVAQELQHQAHRQIARIVSKCLKAVWPEDHYSLQIEFVKRRGKTEAEFVYYRGGHKIEPRQTSGGVRDVVSLALRLVSLVLSQPPRRRVLFLDEPFRMLSKTNREKMAALLESLVTEMGVQMIICTHDSELMIGKVIEL